VQAISQPIQREQQKLVARVERLAEETSKMIHNEQFLLAAKAVPKAAEVKIVARESRCCEVNA